MGRLAPFCYFFAVCNIFSVSALFRVLSLAVEVVEKLAGVSKRKIPDISIPVTL